MDSLASQRRLGVPVAHDAIIDIIDLTNDDDSSIGHLVEANSAVEIVPREDAIEDENAKCGKDDDEEIKFVGEFHASYRRAEVDHLRRLILEEVENAFTKLISAEGNACEYQSRLFTDWRAICVLETAARIMGAEASLEEHAPKCTSVYNYRRIDDKNRPRSVIMFLKRGELVRITRAALQRFIGCCVEEVFTERDIRQRECIVVEDDHTPPDPTTSNPNANMHVIHPRAKLGESEEGQGNVHDLPCHRSSAISKRAQHVAASVKNKAVQKAPRAPICDMQGLGPTRGLALLQRMGWQRGTGLGARKDGRLDPIQVSARRRRAGVGG